MAQATGKRPQELDVPELPAGTGEVWQAFLDLRGASTPAAMGAGPITFPDIVAWQYCHGIEFTPWEIGTILDLDRVALDELNSK